MDLALITYYKTKLNQTKLNIVKWFKTLLYITNNSIKKQLFVYTVKWSNSSISKNSI